MSPWIGMLVFLLGLISFVLLRLPHAKKCEKVKVVESRMGKVEIINLTFAYLGNFILPLLYCFTSLFAFADYTLNPIAFIGGVAFLIAGLWLCHRSHADLSTNWSTSVELRENHWLVDTGIYKHIRHPMYTSFCLYGMGQLLLLSNWIAGPSYLIAIFIILASRIRAEEKMMLEKFGEAYVTYQGRTKRLVPNIY